MVNRWLRANSLIAATASFWLVALSPIPPIGKGVSYAIAIVSGIQLVQESKRLIRQQARAIALDVMEQDLEQLEIALHTQSQETALQEAYAPEVKQELVTSLEHLYGEPSADRNEESSGSSSEKKALYLAVKSLLEIKGKSFVLKEILQLRGRSWDKGEQCLQQLLDEGEENGW